MSNKFVGNIIKLPPHLHSFYAETYLPNIIIIITAHMPETLEVNPFVTVGGVD